MTESSVRVGVRIRPLVSKERGQNVIIDSYDNNSINFRGGTYTFDHVFGMELSQTDLYQNTAAPMLKNFLDGYNCTIMAYGQTGSGKTYTMGTSDINCQDIESQGLIPRFVNDLFENLNQPQEDAQSQETTFKIKVSFLEIYGEDVFDLLSGNSTSPRNDATNRPSLPVREDENGHVFVQGQTEIDVKNAVSTLDVLSAGTHNRITASTAMNAGSSRSHAVFTLHLEQSIRSTANSEDVNTVTSKLTFVDLAGSERIKRTGAEGQRLKEGIQINSGLFNLGQVINSLADEQKLKNGTKTNFVPYRNSKLTHLLKDALGGNSQTLFLACISPAESNESETHSTLNYARQARNIKNKPVRNMDKHQLELRKLRLTAKAWMMKALTLIFPEASPANSDQGIGATSFQSPPRSNAKKFLSPGTATFEACRIQTSFSTAASAGDEEAFLRRPEVIEFINAFNASIQEKVDIATPSPRKIRLSIGFAGYHAPGTVLRSPATVKAGQNYHHNHHHLTSVKKSLYSVQQSSHPFHTKTDDDFSGIPYDEIPAFPATAYKPSGRESILMTADINGAIQAANQLEDSEQLVERMINMVNKEKKLLAGVHHPSSTVHSSPEILSGHDSGDEGERSHSPVPFSATSSALPSQTNSIDEEEIVEVDRLIKEKEEILTKLLDNIKSYQTIKLEFEKLVDAINHLEQEKQELENELEKAKKTNTSSIQLEKMKERFLTIKEQLKKMQQDRKSKESVYQLMQKESKQCEVMQREITKLKEGKVLLAKQQKMTTLALQKLKKENQVKLQSMKKNEIKKQQLVNNLKLELTKKERIIGHKERELHRVSMKLKACEEHITQLLRLQNRQRNKIVNPINSSNNNANSNASNSLGSTTSTSNINSAMTKEKQKSFFSLEKYKQLLENPDYEYYLSSKALLEQVVMSQIEKKLFTVQYQKKSAALKQLNQELLQETQELEQLQSLKKELIQENALTVPPSASAESVKEEEESGGGLHFASEEVHYELENILQRIQYTEQNIERLSKDITLCNSDLDDLSLRLDESVSTANAATGTHGKESAEIALTNAAAGNTNNWQHIGNEVISSFTFPQAQLLINELLNEKISMVEATKLAEIAAQTYQSQYDSLLEKYQENMRLSKKMNENYLSKMKNLAKQRISEIWTILKSSMDSSSAVESATTTAAPDGKGQEIAQQITLLRTKELEKELEIVHQSEESLRQETTTQQQSIQDLEYQLTLLQNQLLTYQQLKAAASTEKTTSTTAALVIPSEFLQEISFYWNAIGVATPSQQEMISSILQSQSIMQQKLLVESKQEYTVKQEVIGKYIQTFELMLSFSGLSFANFLQRYPGKTNAPALRVLLQRSQSLLQSSPQDFTKIKPQKDCLSLLSHYLSVYCTEMIREIYPRFQKMREQGHSLVKEMMLDLEDTAQNASIQLSPAFLQMMKWKSPLSSTIWTHLHSLVKEIEELETPSIEEEALSQWQSTLEEKQQGIITEVSKIFQSFQQVSLSFAQDWSSLEEELKQLNLKRIHWVNQILSLKDSIVSMLAPEHLSISWEEFGQLTQSILQNQQMLLSTASLSLGNDATATEVYYDTKTLEKIHDLSLQILSQKTASNPPGAEKLLIYLEKMIFLLKSIQCNRWNISKALVTLLQDWIQHFQLSTAAKTNPALPAPSNANQLLSRVLRFSYNDEENSTFSLLDFLEKVPKISEPEQSTPPVSLSSCFYQKEFIQQLFEILQEIIEKKWKDLYQYELEVLLSYMKVFNNLTTTATTVTNQAEVVLPSIQQIQATCRQLIQAYHLHASTVRRATGSMEGEEVEAADHHEKMILSFLEFFEECSNWIVFIEENWIQSALLAILSYWKQSINHSSYYAELASSNEQQIRYSLKEIMYQTSFLYSESLRFQMIHETFQEMQKQDQVLVKHLQDLEEFEQQSAKDRTKILQGNSKLLIEEEKYRKQAKKRYEVISEKILQTFQKLITCTTTTSTGNTATTGEGGAGGGLQSPSPAVPVASISGNITNVFIDCKIDLNCFSQYTQNILKNGIQKERLELIRLHTSAAAMFGAPAAPNTTANTITATTANTSAGTHSTAVSLSSNGGVFVNPMLPTPPPPPAAVPAVAPPTNTGNNNTSGTAATVAHPTGSKKETSSIKTLHKGGGSLYKYREKTGLASKSSAIPTSSKTTNSSNNNTSHSHKETTTTTTTRDHHKNSTESTSSNTTAASTTAKSSQKRLSSSHPHPASHRLSINARLSISTAEPGLLSQQNSSTAAATGGGGNGSNYSFQPPTPPPATAVSAGEEEEEENNQNHWNILSGIPLTSSPLHKGSQNKQQPAPVREDCDDLHLTAADLSLIADDEAAHGL